MSIVPQYPVENQVLLLSLYVHCICEMMKSFDQGCPHLFSSIHPLLDHHRMHSLYPATSGASCVCCVCVCVVWCVCVSNDQSTYIFPSTYFRFTNLPHNWNSSSFQSSISLSPTEKFPHTLIIKVKGHKIPRKTCIMY